MPAKALVSMLQQRGVRLAIATGGPRKLCERKLLPHQLSRDFDVVACIDDPDVRAGKPAPDLFLAAAQ
jgi:beta-phosphoglucomutase-like phosphatase (HAD superfamily)